MIKLVHNDIHYFVVLIVLDSGFACSMFGVCQPSSYNGQLFFKLYSILYHKHQGKLPDLINDKSTKSAYYWTYGYMV